MLEKYKKYAKINIISLFFIAVSFMSITLAWFAYSGLTDVETEIGVKAWYIKFDKKLESNNVVIALSDMYPGMETVSENVKINNLGDSDAQISYSILSARLLDKKLEETVQDSAKLEDMLSHDYPFHVNINLNNEYAEAHGGESEFTVSVSWPLDSNNDSNDSLWGSESYKFMEEQLKLPPDQRESQIKIVISLKAEQYIGENSARDPDYNLGDVVLYNVANGKKCTTLAEEDTCIKTHIIDVSSKIEDVDVTLLPDLYEDYKKVKFEDYETEFINITRSWNVTTRPLVIDDLLNIVSRDIINSVLIRDELSEQVIGNLKYEGRLETELNNIKTINEKYNFSHYKFLNDKFTYLSSSKCYWTNTEYDSNNMFSLVIIDDTYSKIYKELKTKEEGCAVVPVIRASKALLENESE